MYRWRFWRVSITFFIIYLNFAQFGLLIIFKVVKVYLFFWLLLRILVYSIFLDKLRKVLVLNLFLQRGVEQSLISPGIQLRREIHIFPGWIFLLHMEAILLILFSFSWYLGWLKRQIIVGLLLLAKFRTWMMQRYLTFRLLNCQPNWLRVVRGYRAFRSRSRPKVIGGKTHVVWHVGRRYNRMRCCWQTYLHVCFMSRFGPVGQFDLVCAAPYMHSLLRVLAWHFL